MRAIALAPMPVVSGVGHETDVTLADFAADLRAPTPTAAAELAAPSAQQAHGRLAAIASLLRQRVEAMQDVHTQRLDQLALRLARPADGVGRRAHRIDLLEQRLASACRRGLERRVVHLDEIEGRGGAHRA